MSASSSAPLQTPLCHLRLRLNWVGRYRWQAGVTADPGWRDGRLNADHTFMLYWAGQGRLLARSGWIELQPGTCVLMHAGWHYQKQEQDPENPLGMNFFHFDFIDVEGRVQTVPSEMLPERLSVPDALLADALMRRVLELRWQAEHEAKSPDGADSSKIALADDLFQSLVRDVLDYSAESVGGTETPAERRQKKLIARAALSMEEAPGQPVDLGILAGQAGYSVDHFTRIFREYTGLSPRNYANRCRLNAARKMLRETSLLIKEISEVLGYENEFYFSRAFKKETGASPRAWRQGNLRIAEK